MLVLNANHSELTTQSIEENIAFINVGGFALRGKGKRIPVSSIAEAKANWKGGKQRGGEILNGDGELMALMTPNGRMQALDDDPEYRNDYYARLGARNFKFYGEE